MMHIGEIIPKFEGVKKNINGFQALCPSHDDKCQSLSISEDSGRILLHCHAGCDTSTILRQIGLSWNDLSQNGRTNSNGNSQTKTEYIYTDEDGKPLYKVIRKEPKAFYQMRYENGGWVIGTKGVHRVPYRLPELLHAIKIGQTIYIAEGEKDVDNLFEKGLTATTNVGGAGKWRDHYNRYFKGASVVILPDNDEPGRKHGEHIASTLKSIAERVRIVYLDLKEKQDVTDWFEQGHTAAELEKITECTIDWEPACTPGAPYNKEPVGDAVQFPPLATNDIVNILDLTIKKDETNKLIVFLCLLSTYTKDSQFNISFNAPSSSGKSYIPIEVAKLFPEEDIIEIGYCSPTAFFHDTGGYDKATNTFSVDLEGKILIFLDQPHSQLLERLRPLLSHDKKIITSKITDKTQKGGIKTKNVVIKGYSSVVFCTAALRIDEQEATRFILLSPNTNEEKIRAAITEKIKKESDTGSYAIRLNNDPARKMLRERIVAIKRAKIEDIKIENPNIISEIFFSEYRKLRPKHQRDIGRVISFVKSLALLNLWHRKREGSTIYANDEDIETAFDIWAMISESQELNLPPYIFNLFNEVIRPLFDKKNTSNETPVVGVSRSDIIVEHYHIFGRYISDWQLRKFVIPTLEDTGLIRQDTDPADRRRMLIFLNNSKEYRLGERGWQSVESEDEAL
jgi:hypothetical protein